MLGLEAMIPSCERCGKTFRDMRARTSHVNGKGKRQCRPVGDCPRAQEEQQLSAAQEGALPLRNHHREYRPGYSDFGIFEHKETNGEEQLVDVADIMSCWQVVVPSLQNPSYNFNRPITAENYGKTPYMVQLIEASRKKITEVIQAEFKRKGSQIKTRIVAYCAYEQRKIVDGAISVTYTDKYHDGETQVLLAE
ncbi:hypothetical protein C1646_750375 [Rhizophagus diaphanus]|nr:hypothetical protein C1646_750375 [Rhizophagus diaphanus] [Rhizophagus sp. MUCL 43196]